MRLGVDPHAAQRLAPAAPGSITNKHLCPNQLVIELTDAGMDTT